VSTYELVAVVRPDLDDEALGAAIDSIHQRIVEHGGTVATSDRWGKRRTAYPLGKHRDAYYALTVFTLDPRQMASLRQALRLHEDLLRFTIATHHPSPAAQPAGAPTQTPAGTAMPARGAAPQPTSAAPATGEGSPPAGPSEGPHV
jgi:small subunit ribosomal protein S6